MQDRFTIREWAARDAFYPLNDLIARSQTTAAVSGAEPINPDDFYPACWMEGVFDGEAYGIPYSTDSRALFYNEDVLVEAGFVDNAGNAKPPATWAELEHYAATLTERDENGRITRLGFAPNYGNSWLYIYGWLNGGAFMSDDGRTVTMNEPRIVGLHEAAVRPCRRRRAHRRVPKRDAGGTVRPVSDRPPGDEDRR